MSGLRLVLFTVNSDAGLTIPRQPLAFFLGGAAWPPRGSLPLPSDEVGVALAGELAEEATPA